MLVSVELDLQGLSPFMRISWHWASGTQDGGCGDVDPRSLMRVCLDNRALQPSSAWPRPSHTVCTLKTCLPTQEVTGWWWSWRWWWSPGHHCSDDDGEDHDFCQRKEELWWGDVRAPSRPRLMAGLSKLCLLLLISCLLISYALAEVELPPSCPGPLVIRQEMSSPLETFLSSLSSAGVPYRRRECPPGKEEMHVGPPTLCQGLLWSWAPGRLIDIVNPISCTSTKISASRRSWLRGIRNGHQWQVWDPVLTGWCAHLLGSFQGMHQSHPCKEVGRGSPGCLSTLQSTLAWIWRQKCHRPAWASLLVFNWTLPSFSVNVYS